MTSGFPRPRNIFVSKSARIGWNALLGVPEEKSLEKCKLHQSTFNNKPVKIGKRTVIGCNVVIYEGVEVGNDVIIEDGVNIGPDSVIDAKTRICYSAIVCDGVSIGKNCVIAGFVCDEAVVESGCRIFGALLHEQSQPHRDWWQVHEAPPRIKPHCTIGWGALVIGRISVGPYCYVMPGAIVRKSVPPKSIVCRNGEVVSASAWRGKKLRKLITWWNRE